MAKWWMGVALAAVVASQHNAAVAQSPAGAPPEPAPCAPSMLGQDVVPGPLGPSIAPPGPCPELSLPANHTSAFSCEHEATHPECYLHVGTIGLQRGRLGHGQVSFLDPGNGTDTGIRPILLHDLNNTTLDYSALVPALSWGVTATVGYAVDNWAVELSGYYISGEHKEKTVTNPGKLDLNFINPPIGFEGDNGLWLQADRVSLINLNALASGELNIRYANPAMGCIEPLIGVRYLDVREQLAILTDDDGLTFPDINGNPDPLRIATYYSTVHSHIIAPQLGLELQTPVYSRVAFTASAKGAWGANFVDRNTSLLRGDGFVGFETHSSHTQFSHLYDVGAYFDFYLLERMRVRAGYNLLWVVNVPEAKSQVDFDLMHTQGQRADHGSIFFHGPVIEMQFLF
jgi:hypothetical protein